jgi:tripartite-type tricarboxylate transporter receptor subunit TctC
MMPSLIRLFPLLFAATVVATSVEAQTAYPSKPVTVICTYAAGGGGDLIVRKYAAGLKDLTGQNFLVENRVGANGHIGNRAAMEARPDGYTMLITGSSSMVGNPLIMKDATYDPVTALQSVATLTDVGLILVVNANSDIKSVADLSRYIKAKKSEAKYASATVSHRLVSPWYLQSIGAEAIEVGYKSTADAINDISAGLVDFVFADATLALGQAAQGRIRLIATTTKSRLSFAPDLPTMEESGVPGLVYSVIWSAWVPKNTPPAIVNQLHGWLNAITGTAESRKFLNQIGSDPYVVDSPAAMEAVMKGQHELWQRLVPMAKLEKQ